MSKKAEVILCISKRKYLPLWAAASTQTQNMLPALFSGLIYAIELLQIIIFTVKDADIVHWHFQTQITLLTWGHIHKHSENSSEPKIY